MQGRGDSVDFGKEQRYLFFRNQRGISVNKLRQISRRTERSWNSWPQISWSSADRMGGSGETREEEKVMRALA